MKTYLWQLAIALDQLANALLGGYADETLSARAYRTSQAGKLWGIIFKPVIDGLFYALTLGQERDHCFNSYLSELNRVHLHKDYRKS